MLHTVDLDLPTLTVALKQLDWSVADLATAAKLSEQHVRDVVAGKVFNGRTTRALQDAVNDALAARRSA